MKKLMIATLTTGFLLSNAAFADTTVIEAPAKAATCIGCHGEGGNSVVPTFPKLAGQHASYIEKQLKDFRDGFRKDSMMQGFVKGMTDEEIKELAAYYAAQSPK